MKPGAIVVLARVPRPGQAKTRLEPRLGAVGAAALAACFLQDTLTGALAVGADVFLAFTPAECQGEVRSLVLPGVHLFPQVEGDLGRRQAAAFRIARSQGPGPVLLIGSDSPTLPVPILADALARLRAAPEEILLGPTEDGGYYLLGLSEWPGGLLDQVTWSSPTVYETVRANAAARGRPITPLPPWWDVDEPDDLDRLHAALQADRAARERAPHTARWWAQQEENRRLRTEPSGG